MLLMRSGHGLLSLGIDLRKVLGYRKDLNSEEYEAIKLAFSELSRIQTLPSC